MLDCHSIGDFFSRLTLAWIYKKIYRFEDFKNFHKIIMNAVRKNLLTKKAEK